MALCAQGIPPLRVLSVCSGGGGLDVGIRLAAPGSRTVCYLEREAPAVAALVAGMASGALCEAPVWSDATTFDGRRWRGVVDCVAGGTPCPEFSLANPERKATPEERLATARGSLFCRLVDIADECAAPWLLWENVGGATDALPLCFAHLAASGFTGAWARVRASDVGASSPRARVFVLAHRDGARLEESRPLRGPLGTSEGQTSERGGVEMGTYPPGPDDVGLWARVLRAHPYLAPVAPQPALRRVDDGLDMVVGGVGRRDSIYLLGNGVVPEQAAAALRLLWPAVHGGMTP
ncbi:DNA cytosine methyltransferase [Myxococcus landrumensis]|uniref:DNA (cytosine-5-)-methyltransferase n=1 Tax=Myxococcus landrumensis TaxID=2813577 RepID=A0ABX7NCP3_9BACT|nr:DNA cytosine methyltransferase [Myxococcus landrumus]